MGLYMINEALRLVRVYHDLTQTQLSQQLQISNSHLSELESGKKQPTLEVLKKYSEFFDIPVSSLLFFSENIGSYEANLTTKFRRGAAKKIISLLQWMDAKNELQRNQI